MARISFRQITPRSFYGRSLLLTIFPIGVSLALMVGYYFNGHMRGVNTKLSQNVARDIALVRTVCETSPEDVALHAMIEAELHLSFGCQNTTEAWPPLGDQSFFYADLVRTTISEMVATPVQIGLLDGNRRLDVRLGNMSEGPRIVIERKRAININGHNFIVWIVGVSLVLTATALAFLRNHVRSILRLARAVQAFGTRRQLEDFRPSGAREVRAAARAVINMRRRLTSFAEQRTTMLAGVSHDLRTPLARLQLQLAMLEQTDDIKAARKDVRDMEMMLEEYLAFARGAETERYEDVDLPSLLKDIVDDYERAELITPTSDIPPIAGQPLALKRAFSNLITNALTYGDRVELGLHLDKDFLVILVEDNGPGIPPDQHEEAFRPFARLNEARTQNKPGVGLGLALTRDTAESHGGSISLSQSPMGGLQAEVRLPL